MFIFLKKSISKKTLNSGFTLVELLVTITIFVILTGVVLVNSNSFDSSILLHNFAYDVALTIKQAQTYGVNVSENVSGTFNSSGEAYGVYFNTAILGGNTQFVLFDDLGLGNTPYDKKYDSGDVTNCPANDPNNLECLQKYSMRRGTFIQSMCAGTIDSCARTSQLSILFQRPNLNALIYMGGSSVQTVPPPSYAKIVLSSATGATSSVVVTSIGQIYVK